MPHSPVHLLVDFVVDEVALVHTPQPGMTYLREAVSAGGASILTEHVHQFRPAGYSGILLLAQSHASIHTWVEDNLISVDVFGCGPIDMDAVITTLRRRFRPLRERIERRERGLIPRASLKPSPSPP